MIEFIKLILLGIAQGIAEFLPISSSGHLLLLEKLFNVSEPSLFLAQMLHFGTFLSVFVVFFKDIKRLFIAFFSQFKFLFNKDKQGFKLTSDQKMGWYIILASIPTAVIAFVFDDIFKEYYNNFNFLGFMFLSTAALLVFGDYFSKKNNHNEFTSINSFAIGCVQGLAILPGISRSGSTIFAGLFLNINKTNAAKFSFLISLPATFGAFIFGIKDLIKNPTEIQFTFSIFVATVVSFVVGIFAIKLLFKMLEKSNFKYFSIYLILISALCFAVGLF